MALLVQVIVKVSIVLLAAWAMTRVMSRSSAAARHLVWTMAVVTALVLPIAQLIGPTWDLPVLPGQSGVTVGSEPPSLDSTQRAASVTPEPDVAIEPAPTTTPPTTTPPPEPATSPWATLSWTTIAALAWLAITILAVGRLFAGLAWVSWTTRRATDVTDEGWLQILDDAAAVLGVTRPVSLRTSARTTIPVACGIWQPMILLPLDAAEWPDERRRVVLLHEMAHVARRDCLTQAIVQFLRALYWFNPLAHVAAVRLRVEQERACDDLVIAAGTDGTVYADHLIELARSFCAERFPAWATLAMARPSQLEGRVVAILDDRCNRRPPDRRVRVAMAAVAAALILPISALQLTAAGKEPAAAGAQLTTTPDALIDPNPILPQRDAQSEFDTSVPLTAGGGIDVLVNAAMQMVDMLPHFDLDLTHANWNVHADRDPNPIPDPDPDPQVFVEPKFKTDGDAPFKLGATASAQTQTQTQTQTSDVTDETRRRVADALIMALNDENAEVRAEALGALANMRDARAIPGLLKAQGDANANVRQRALSALSQFSTPEAVAGIVAALKDANADVRSQAARQVNALISRGTLRDASYTDLLIGLLRDASQDVRQQAIAALGNSRRREVVPSLLPMLKDANVDVREQAASALGAIADPSAIDALTAALKDADPGVREQVARALGQIARGQRRGVGPGVPVPPVPPARPGVAVPPVPPRPGQPSAFNFPNFEIDEAALRAQAEALREFGRQLNSPEFRRQMEEAQREIEEAQREIEEAQREIQRNNR